MATPRCWMSSRIYHLLHAAKGTSALPLLLVLVGANLQKGSGVLGEYSVARCRLRRRGVSGTRGILVDGSITRPFLCECRLASYQLRKSEHSAIWDGDSIVLLDA